MDERAVDATRRHYDRHAGGDMNENMKRRREGPALPLKNFHNQIKACLIRRFCYGVDKVLDFCCGRGGDLRKWDQAKVKFVRGLDLSPGEIEEAWLRFDSHKRQNRWFSLQVEFEATDALGSGSYKDPHAPYDIVSCFFALHYFMVSEDAIHNLLLNVSSNLKKGGYFIGTCPDGKKVVSSLMNSEQKHKVETPMLKLMPRWEGDYKCFGSAYSCAITDTVTAGHDDSSGSYEYLVFRNVVKGIAAKFGLKLVKTYDGDEESTECFVEEDQSEGFKHFKPNFPNSDPSLELASSLNMAFVFQKVAEFEKTEEGEYVCKEYASQEACAPPPPPANPQARNNRNRGFRGQKRRLEDDDASKGATQSKQRIKVEEGSHEKDGDGGEGGSGRTEEKSPNKNQPRENKSQSRRRDHDSRVYLNGGDFHEEF
ncbi:hypothetical protein BSKO_00573 [Bryopsis sp. KO-2023]|nr:hypothetical protein BSKO_00573 [Bryopsis sp. KO-2023]